MHRYTLFFILSVCSFWSYSQEEYEQRNAHAIFEPNLGQWEGDFDYKIDLSTGALFFEDGGYTTHLWNPHQAGSHEHDGSENAHEDVVPFKDLQRLAYRVTYEGANLSAEKEGVFENTFYRNYFRGKDTTKWVSAVPTFGGLKYTDFYSDIDLLYYSKGDHFKYDFIVHPGGNPEQIVWKVDGTEMSIVDRELHYLSPFDDVIEWRPVAYQIVNGEKIYVDISFQLEDNKASFDIGKYDPNLELVIDPVLVFSTLSGSYSDNWGFSATPDLNGGLYGAGICFGTGYPTTTGSYDPTYNPGANGNREYTDVAISKYSPDGSTLVYATYLGGSEVDQAHSMIVNSQGQLVIYGATGSDNFPVRTNAPYPNFNGGPTTFPFRDENINNAFYYFGSGTDAYVAILSPNGQNLVGSTYLGGTGRDGINTSIQRNYGDGSRGEVVVDDNDNIYVTTTTFSSDYPLVNSTVGGNAGSSDVAVTKLNSTAGSVIWSTTFGGSGADQGYGIKVGQNGNVYVTGGTNSSSLPGTSGSVKPTYGGSVDGFLTMLNSDGSVNRTTYVGTGSYDQSFFVDIDKNNAVYVFGQTLGNYPISNGVWSHGSTRQFIHKYNADLTQTIFSTAFGSGSSSINLVPTAFNVDDCLNILLSGWGGNVNSSPFLGGSVNSLPTTPDAAQAVTDGSDFYLMSLNSNASSLTYATFFGGSASEHVDGGTSRFSHDGQIYQAVCASCGNGSFPTTPGAYSQTDHGSNCNLGNLKFNFEVSILAAADIDYTTDVDTVCNTLTVEFSNDSKNANVFMWDFGNGQTSSDVEPTVDYTQFGSYTVTLVAIDTICDISDTAYLQIDHDQGIEPTADFELSFTVCDQSRTVYLTNNSTRATNYIWDFGNGVVLNGPLSSYSYPAEGIYTVQLVAADTICDKYDTVSVQVTFVTNIQAPVVNITPSSCLNGKFDVYYLNDSAYYQYRWEWEDGSVEWNKYPDSKVPHSGLQEIKLTIVDTVCNQQFEYSFMLDITRIDNRVYIPNSFSPNGDGVNDVFLLKGNTCLDRTRFTILNRWGQVVFETDTPFSEFWDGTFNDGNIKEDTYVYIFRSEDGERKGHVTVIP